MASLEPGAQRSGSTAPAPGRGGAVVRGPPRGAGSGRSMLRCRRVEHSEDGRRQGRSGRSEGERLAHVGGEIGGAGAGVAAAGRGHHVSGHAAEGRWLWAWPGAAVDGRPPAGQADEEHHAGP